MYQLFIYTALASILNQLAGFNIRWFLNANQDWSKNCYPDLNQAAFLTKKGFKVSRNIVKKLLKKHNYLKRKPLKKAGGGHINRNAQFERIAELRKHYESEGHPVISVDTKKKKNLLVICHVTEKYIPLKR